MSAPQDSSNSTLSTNVVGNLQPRSRIEDQSSPYYLHHSDSSGGSLVSNVLTGTNYMPWSRSILIILDTKNKLSFIDGTITKPPPKEPDLLRLRSRNNRTIIGWIMNLVCKEISLSSIFGGTTRSVWNYLQERFQLSNGPRIFQLR